MKRFALLALTVVATAANAQFVPGNLAVCIVGDGSVALSGQTAYPVSIRQYTTAGAQVGSDVNLPATTSGAQRTLTSQTDETNEAGLTVSVDGRYLMVVGYNVPVFTAGAGFFADRTLARVSSFQGVDTVTGLPWSEAGGDSVRTLYSLDGNNFWVASGSAGIDYIPYGQTSGSVEIVGNFTSTRFLTSYAGNFYYTSSDDNAGLSNSFYKVAGNPTTGPATPTLEFALNPSPRGFAFASPTTLYLASSTGSAGLVKYQLISGSWVEQYRTAAITGGLNAIVLLNGKIYATKSNGENILEITDTGSGFTSNVIATAPLDRTFKGLSVTPATTRPITGQINLLDWTASTDGRTAVVELTAPGSGTVLETTVVALDSTGAYSVATALAPGSYDLYAKSSHWLRKKVAITLTGSGASGVNASLINGDCDGDNEVGIGDYSILSVAYNTSLGDPNFDASADLNGDDSVDIADYALLSGNYGLIGD